MSPGFANTTGQRSIHDPSDPAKSNRRHLRLQPATGPIGTHRRVSRPPARCPGSAPAPTDPTAATSKRRQRLPGTTALSAAAATPFVTPTAAERDPPPTSRHRPATTWSNEQPAAKSRQPVALDDPSYSFHPNRLEVHRDKKGSPIRPWLWGTRPRRRVPENHGHGCHGNRRRCQPA